MLRTADNRPASTSTILNGHFVYVDMGSSASSFVFDGQIVPQTTSQTKFGDHAISIKPDDQMYALPTPIPYVLVASSPHSSPKITLLANKTVHILIHMAMLQAQA